MMVFNLQSDPKMNYSFSKNLIPSFALLFSIRESSENNTGIVFHRCCVCAVDIYPVCRDLYRVVSIVVTQTCYSYRFVTSVAAVDTIDQEERPPAS